MAPKVKHHTLSKDLEIKFKHKQWNSLSNFIEKNKDSIKYVVCSGKTLLFMCYQSDETPMYLIKLISDLYPEQVRILCRKRRGGLFAALDRRTTILHEGIDNHINLCKLTYLLELDMRLENEKSIATVCDGKKRFPLHSFMRHFSFYSSQKNDDVLRFASMLIDMNQRAIHCRDFRGRIPLSFLLSQLKNQHIQKNDNTFMQVTNLLVSAYNSYPQWKSDFVPVIRSSLTGYSPQRLKVISLLMRASPPTNESRSPLRLFIQMDFEENELKWLVENSSEKVLRYEYGEILELLWMQHVDKWHSALKSSLKRSEYHKKSFFFFNRQEACLKAIMQSIRDTQMKKEEQATYKNLKKFWTRIHIILGCPRLILHKLCKIQCPRALIEIAVLLHPEHLSTYDSDGKLPLHISLTNNTSYAYSKKITHEDWFISQGKVKKVRSITKAELLFQFYPEAVREKDEDLDVYPFMIAAINSDLNLTYKMLRGAPEVVIYGYQNNAV